MPIVIDEPSPCPSQVRVEGLKPPCPSASPEREDMRGPLPAPSAVRSPEAAVRNQSEAAVRACCEAGKLHDAASAAVALYGPELLRFLHVRLRSRAMAEEAFGMLCEALWRGLAQFAWRSSLRTWLFVLVRNVVNELGRAGQRERRLLEQAADDFREQCARVRTTTAIYQQTETKSRVRALRELLDNDQQTLLVLRIERGLSWRELALVMGELEVDADEAEYERASARVRTRFQAAKRRLRELAREAGLLPEHAQE